MALPEKNKLMVEEGVRLILRGLGEDLEREGLRDTPKRVSKMYSEILDGKFVSEAEFAKKITAFEEESYQGLIIVRKVPFYSFCAHHLLMFSGTFSMGYLPSRKILGLSKLVRIFRRACKLPTTQETITEAAVNELVKYAEPKGAICCVDASHACMELRGVKSPGSITTTMSWKGVFVEDRQLRDLFVQQSGRVQ